MKQYLIELDDNSAEFYEKIGETIKHTPNKIIEDTLIKVVDLLSKKCNTLNK